MSFQLNANLMAFLKKKEEGTLFANITFVDKGFSLMLINGISQQFPDSSVLGDKAGKAGDFGELSFNSEGEALEISITKKQPIQRKQGSNPVYETNR